MAWNQPGGGGKDPWKSKGSKNPVDDFMSKLKDQRGLGSPNSSGASGWIKKGLVLLALLLVTIVLWQRLPTAWPGCSRWPWESAR